MVITTSDFSETAKHTARSLAAGNQLVILLIDGHELARLMIEYEVGVFVKDTYEIKDLDENYFLDENAEDA